MEENKKEDSCHCEENDQCCQDNNKKTKNLISIAILLAGLFLGSLFVDAYQAVRGSGYSVKNLNKSDIFQADGKTWVAYNDPAVPVKIITDDKCEKCDVTDAVIWLRRVLPTVSTEKVAYDSEGGKKLIEENSIKTLPAFIFDKNLEKTELFTQAAMVFSNIGDSYTLKTQDIGMTVGKYLATPSISDDDASVGPKDAKAQVVIFSDYQCPYCKVLYGTLREIMDEYKDKAQFVYKHLPLESHPQAVPASLASRCAQEQNKFWEYSDLLYKNQASWGKTKDTNAFKDYARNLGLNTQTFNQCLDSKKYQAAVEADKKEGQDFGISGTPAVFIGDQFENGALSKEQLKTMIDEQLNK